MARARYGGERGAGPLAARLRACGPTTAAPRRRRREALWSAATTIRLADTRRLGQARGLAHSRRRTRRRPTTSCSAPTRSPSCRRPSDDARLRPVREDLDARPRLPGARGRRGVRATGTSRGTVRVAFAHWAEPAEDGGAQLHLRGARGPGRHPRPPAAEGDLGACSARSSAWSARSRSNWPCGGRGRTLRIPPGWSGLGARGAGRPATGSRRPAACSPRRAGRRSTASPR